MVRINVLDEHTSNKIAAGEVVERPASVIKELVENSIDAQAKNITIEVLDGGINLIKVIDDGVGVYKDDIEKAFLPHATSKIKNVEDIYSINTLGFRGEALPSIASVSKVNFKSRQQSESFGKEIVIDAGLIVSINDTGINIGSVMEVRDLFYNVPARRKFLKSPSREGSLINDIVTRIALSNPNISFKLFNNNKKVLHTYGNNDLGDTIRTIYGKNIYENILSFESSSDLISIYGYIGKEEIARGSRGNQSIFVNKRFIKNKTIVAAIENAFKSFSTINKFPFFVIFIDIPSDFIDVNIHPTKAEIKFKDERIIFKKVFDTVHNTLKNYIFNSFSEEVYLNTDKFSIDKVENIEFQINDSDKPEYTPTNDISIMVDNDRDKVETLIKSIYNSITIDEVTKEEALYDRLKNLSKDSNYNVCKVEIEDINQVCDSSLYSNSNNINYSIESSAKFPELKIIGQFNKTYILAEHKDCLYMIDQHAAHEKIKFEKYIKDIENNTIVIQPLLIPALIDLSIDDYSYFIENVEVFKESGFIIEEFGDSTISIKEVPYFLGKLDAKKLFLEILDNLKNLGSGKTTEVKFNKIASMACKAAIKANDHLTEMEMKELINELRFINDPFHCPHGRPVIIKFTDYELAKKFRRIV